MAQATVVATAKLDVSPDGVKITFEGLDADLANLMASAQTYTAEPTEYRSYDTCDLIIKTTKVIQFVTPTVIEVVPTP